MTETDIVIVGGGPAGLSAAGALKHAGMDALVLDRNNHIGGSWTRRYDRLHLHTVRSFSGLAHFRIPRQYPRYLPKDSYAEYLQEYARRLNLDVALNCTVRTVRLREGHSSAGLPPFLVETDRGAWQSRVVVVATGHFGTPMHPAWPAQEVYTGSVMHSTGYTTGRIYTGKRVLVIGMGNSGTEIATDLAEQGAASIAISARTQPPVVPRDFLGTPVQVFGILLSVLPSRMADRISAALARLALGDLTQYGLKPPAWWPFGAKRVPTIDVGFVRELRKGRIQIRPGVTRFTRTGVVYEDGREEAFDQVLLATGFQTGLDRLLEVPTVLNANAFPRFPSGRPTSQPGLYFMGYTESPRGHLFEANRDSRRLAGIIGRFIARGEAS